MMPYMDQNLPLHLRVKQAREYHQQVKQHMEQHELDKLFNEQSMEEATQKAIDDGLPKGLADLLKTQMGQITKSNPFALPPQPEFSESEMIAKEIERKSLEFAGIYFEDLGKGHATIYDFPLFMRSAVKINIEPELVELLLTDGSESIIEGDAVVAFMRYLHYIGVFQVEKAKQPCPECAHLSPQDCLTCGGIGWVCNPQPVKQPDL